MIEARQDVDGLLLNQSANGVRHSPSTHAQRAEEKVERDVIERAVAAKAERSHATVADCLSEEICNFRSRRIHQCRCLDTLSEDC